MRRSLRSQQAARSIGCNPLNRTLFGGVPMPPREVEIGA